MNSNFAVGNSILNIQGKGARKGMAMANIIHRLCLKLPFKLSRMYGMRIMANPIAVGTCIEIKKQVKINSNRYLS